MNINKIFAVIAIVSVLLDACTLTLTPTPIVPVTGATPESIGEISAEKTLVESGPSEALDRVSDTRQFFNHDTVRVTNGGTAKLDFFVNQISIRLFNDTAVGDIKADPSGTPDRAVRMKLVFGGLSGEVTKNGIPIYFEITNGVNIYVLGTQFLVLYDPNNGTTYIGNFDGTVAYSIPGQPSVQFIQAGQLYEISPSFETRTVIMNFTRTDIENLTLDRRSTLLDALENYLAITATPTSTTPPLSPINTLTATPVSAITPAQTEIISCDRAAFVTDVTVPDGTPFTPGSQFTKVWRLRNVGTCTWTNGYSLVFYGGQQMDGPVSINIPSLVAPGQTIDIPIGLVAPLIPGSYRGEWILMNAAGTVFGVDANGIGPIWVTINVISIATITVTAFSTGGITGTAFSDGNSNNVPETGEVAQGLTVTLYNSTGNGMLAVTTTNSAGVYTFLNLSAGTYYVKWVVTGCNQPDAREATVNVSPGGTQIQDLTTSILC